MIIKEKQFEETGSGLTAAGNRHEKSVAFYLRRAFKDDERVFVFNDLFIEHDKETAQIDHLILYPYGFIILESKSITGEVRVNREGEWSRSYKGRWSGIPSPLNQARLQQEVLKGLLSFNRTTLLRKLLGMQGGFGGRQYTAICTVSNNAIIDRKTLSPDINGSVVKADNVADKIIDIMRLPKGLLAKLNPDARPDFNKDEMDSICKFLMDIDLQTRNKVGASSVSVEEIVKPGPKPSEGNENTKPKTKKAIALELFESTVCKSCHGHDDLEFKGGRYGYYVHCSKCDINTSIAVPK